MASTDTLAVERTPRRRRARLLLLLVTVLAVAAGAWFARRRRPPALPAFTAEAQPGPSTTDRPKTQGSPAVEPVEPVDPAPTARVAPAPSGDHGSRPAPSAPSAASEDLQRVSGIGRRSAEALVAAGIDSLDRLAGTDDATLVAALEAAGLRRSPTLSAWASQARRLTQA